MIAHQRVPESYEEKFTARLNTVGYDLLSPVFVVVSGMKIDTNAVADNI